MCVSKPIRKFFLSFDCAAFCTQPKNTKCDLLKEHNQRRQVGGGGGTLIFPCIRRLGSFSFWGVQNFEFHFFLRFQKNEYSYLLSLGFFLVAGPEGVREILWQNITFDKASLKLYSFV